jgi:hypothetical protein
MNEEKLSAFDRYPDLRPESYWDHSKNEGVYDFSSWDIPRLKEHWSLLEQMKIECHPESGFQPLINSEMRQLKDEIKKRNRLKHLK